MKRLFASLFVFAAVSGVGQNAPVEYRFDEVKRTVTLKHDHASQNASKGLQAAGGDVVETGWFSYALIGSERHRARFEIFSSTQVTLASNTPGVILTVNRGRIRAAFDKIVGSEPRTVQTPGALLAVRGTQFDVQVERSGTTTVDVFEGVVEIQSKLRPEPLLIRAGEQSIFSPHVPPVMRPMPEERRRNAPEGTRDGDRNREGDRNRPRDGNNNDRPPSRGNDGGGRMQPPSPPSGGGSNPPQQPAPPPPPRKPPV